MTRLSAFAASAFLLSTLASLPASAQTINLKERTGIGPFADVFLPTDSKTRNSFGDSWINVGLNFVDVLPATQKGALLPDSNVLYQTHGDNHAFVVFTGLQYRRGFGEGTQIRPYVGTSLNVIFADLKSVQEDVHSGFKTGVAGGAFVGTTFGNRGFAEARYTLTSKVKTFDLSGTSLSVGMTF